MTAIELRFSSHAHARYLADLRRFVDAVHALTVHDRRDRAAALARWARGFFAELDRHRRTEREVIFPDFADRVRWAGPVVERLEESDVALGEVLAGIPAALDRLFSPVVPFAVARLELERLAVLVGEELALHVIMEETELLPLVDGAYTRADYAHLMRCVEAWTPSMVDGFALPWALDGATPTQRAAVLRALGRRDRMRLAIRLRRYRRHVQAAFPPARRTVDIVAAREFALAA